MLQSNQSISLFIYLFIYFIPLYIAVHCWTYVIFLSCTKRDPNSQYRHKRLTLCAYKTNLNVIKRNSGALDLHFRVGNIPLKYNYTRRDPHSFNNLFRLFQDHTPRCPIQPRRLLPVVGVKELCGQGAIQDHDACSVQRTAVVPAADAGVP